MIRNTVPRKGEGTRKFNGKLYYYVGRTLYNTKARSTALELSMGGNNIKVTTSRGMGYLLWSEKPVQVDLSEQFSSGRGYYNPVTTCPVCGDIVTTTGYRSEALSKHFQEKRHNPASQKYTKQISNIDDRDRFKSLIEKRYGSKIIGHYQEKGFGIFELENGDEVRYLDEKKLIGSPFGPKGARGAHFTKTKYSEFGYKHKGGNVFKFNYAIKFGEGTKAYAKKLGLTDAQIREAEAAGISNAEHPFDALREFAREKQHNPGGQSTLKCLFCGKVFKKTIGPKTYEIKCPKCGEIDVDIIGNPPDIVSIKVHNMGKMTIVYSLDKYNTKHKIRTFKSTKGGLKDAFKYADSLQKKYNVQVDVQSNPLTAVHPLAIDAKKKWKEDMKAGHAGGKEYWAGYAGAAYLLSNPLTLHLVRGGFGTVQTKHNSPSDNLTTYKLLNNKAIWKTLTDAKRDAKNAGFTSISFIERLGGQGSKPRIIKLNPVGQANPVRNVLPEITAAAITGVGLGIGFKGVDWAAKKINGK